MYSKGNICTLFKKLKGISFYSQCIIWMRFQGHVLSFMADNYSKVYQSHVIHHLSYKSYNVNVALNIMLLLLTNVLQRTIDMNGSLHCWIITFTKIREKFWWVFMLVIIRLRNSMTRKDAHVHKTVSKVMQ